MRRADSNLVFKIMKSECKCQNYSCEPVQEHEDGIYYRSETRRFRFVKEDNCITDEIEIRGQKYKSGVTEGSIDTCEIKLSGHNLRSIANDDRTGKSHSEHWKKESKRHRH